MLDRLPSAAAFAGSASPPTVFATVPLGKSAAMTALHVVGDAVWVRTEPPAGAPGYVQAGDGAATLWLVPEPGVAGEWQVPLPSRDAAATVAVGPLAMNDTQSPRPGVGSRRVGAALFPSHRTSSLTTLLSDTGVSRRLLTS